MTNKFKCYPEEVNSIEKSITLIVMITDCSKFWSSVIIFTENSYGHMSVVWEEVKHN